MSAAAPFEFQCRRSGRCCRHGEGYIWVAPAEVARLAAALGLAEEPFRERYLSQVDGRLSLRTEAGRCVLLEGANQCRIYAARPTHCAEFPYWPEILAGGEALQRAQEMCPGIRPAVEPAARALAFERLAALYERLDAELERLRPVCRLRGVCCDFARAGHDLFATRLEADFAVSGGLEGPRPEAVEPARPAGSERRLCPYWREQRCHARGSRPLGCRVYFCDPGFRGKGEALYERYYGEIQEICVESGYPFAYGKFLELLPEEPQE